MRSWSLPDAACANPQLLISSSEIRVLRVTVVCHAESTGPDQTVRGAVGCVRHAAPRSGRASGSAAPAAARARPNPLSTVSYVDHNLVRSGAVFGLSAESATYAHFRNNFAATESCSLEAVVSGRPRTSACSSFK